MPKPKPKPKRSATAFLNLSSEGFGAVVRVQIRIDQDEEEFLDALCDAHDGATRAAVLRTLVRDAFGQLCKRRTVERLTREKPPGRVDRMSRAPKKPRCRSRCRTSFVVEGKAHEQYRTMRCLLDLGHTAHLHTGEAEGVRVDWDTKSALPEGVQRYPHERRVRS